MKINPDQELKVIEQNRYSFSNCDGLLKETNKDYFDKLMEEMKLWEDLSEVDIDLYWLD